MMMYSKITFLDNASEKVMPYLFLGLLVANILMFGFYSFLYKPSPSDSVSQTQATLKNPVTFTNVSNELPPMIGTKK